MFWKYENWVNEKTKLRYMIQNAINFCILLATSSYKMPHFWALHSITCHIGNAVHVNENKNTKQKQTYVNKKSKNFRKSVQFYGFYEDLHSILQHPCFFRVLRLYFYLSKGVAGLAYLCCHGKGSSRYWSFFLTVLQE